MAVIKTIGKCIRIQRFKVWCPNAVSCEIDDFGYAHTTDVHLYGSTALESGKCGILVDKIFVSNEIIIGGSLKIKSNNNECILANFC